MPASPEAAPLTGRKVFAITALFFGVIIAANGTLAFNAIRSFPGVEVDNSYVASQGFNAQLAAQKALGWQLQVSADGSSLALAFIDADGRPVQPVALTASVGRATEAADDSLPAFAYAGGRFTAPVALAPGKWVLRIDAQAADGTEFRQRVTFQVKG